MAEVRYEKILCPKCGEEIEVTVWESMNMPYDSENKERIMDNTFFNVTCKSCGITMPLGYRFEYNDMDKRYTIRVMPDIDEKGDKIIEEYNEKMEKDKAFAFARKDFTARLVRNGVELREKILIFDEGLDDRIIELMKYVCYMEAEKNDSEERKAVGVVFDKGENDDYLFLVFFDDGNYIDIDVDMEMYEKMKEELGERIEANTPKGLSRIYGGWAGKILSENKNFEK